MVGDDPDDPPSGGGGDLMDPPPGNGGNWMDPLPGHDDGLGRPPATGDAARPGWYLAVMVGFHSRMRYLLMGGSSLPERKKR